MMQLEEIVGTADRGGGLEGGKLKVAVLGATGMVGQQLVLLLHVLSLVRDRCRRCVLELGREVIR